MSTLNQYVKSRNLKKFFIFAVVGGFGTILNTAILYILTSLAGLNYIIASICATESAIVSNFLGNNYITFKDKNNNGIFKKFLSFQVISLIALVGTIFFLWLFVTLFGKNLLLIWNVIAILIMFLVNFILNSTFTWKNKVQDIAENDSHPNKTNSSHKNFMKGILILFIFALLIHASGSVNAASMKNRAHNIILTPNTTHSKISIVDTTNISDNLAINSPTIQSNNSTTNPAVIPTSNAVIDNTTNNKTTSAITPLIDNNAINIQSINSTINALAQLLDNNTTNTTINDTGNQTTNTTINQTINDTGNQTINNTGNTSSNQSINTTINDTGNQTTNTTINQTINDTNNQTINITDNSTTNTTINQTINDTGNQTINTTINQTINDTGNQTINNTGNTTINQTINDTGNQTINNTGNTSSNQTINNSNISSSIIANGTDLTSLSYNNGIATYYLREDSNATFYIDLNETKTVTWYVDGIEQAATSGNSSTFDWIPGILWVPRAPDFGNTAESIITASTPDDSVSWIVDVEDVINPFFTSMNDSSDIIGSPDTKIHVYTNNNLVNFTYINVTILSSNGNIVYSLVKQYSDAIETDWSLYIPDTIPGNNYLTTITGFDKFTGTTLTYNIGTSRAHYRTIPKTTGGSGTGKKGGGGGGSLGSTSSGIPELIYVTIDKDVLTKNQMQTISLDAKDFQGGIEEVSVKLLTPDKYMRELELNLTAGTKEYGTWSTSFGNFVPGQYNISSVSLKSYSQTVPTEIKIQNRSFYYTSDLNASNFNLSLIYSVLDENNVKNGTLVTLTIDAEDSNGITAATAYIINTLGKNQTLEDAFSIPLNLSKGNKEYGTWTGTFTAVNPDTTYTVTNITLKNAKESKVYSISDRSVYVLAIPNDAASTSVGVQQQQSLLAITGAIIELPFSREGINTIIKDPFAPTIIGFIIMLIVAGSIIFISNKY